MSGTPAFELSFWCGTCPFLCERLEGSNSTQSIEGLQDTLAEGLSEIDEDVMGAFSALLPTGESAAPRARAHTHLPHEARRLLRRGTGQDLADLRRFLGLARIPPDPYYRGDTRALDDENVLFEFVVPMVPPAWNDRQRVAEHSEQLRHSRPTCVTLSRLDVRQRAVANTPEEGLIHWGLAHFLLDGHHKIEAAAAAGARLRILSLLSIDHSLADADAVARAIDLLSSDR